MLTTPCPVGAGRMASEGCGRCSRSDARSSWHMPWSLHARATTSWCVGLVGTGRTDAGSARPLALQALARWLEDRFGHHWLTQPASASRLYLTRRYRFAAAVANHFQSTHVHVCGLGLPTVRQATWRTGPGGGRVCQGPARPRARKVHLHVRDGGEPGPGSGGLGALEPRAVDLQHLQSSELGHGGREDKPLLAHVAGPYFQLPEKGQVLRAARAVEHGGGQTTMKQPLDGQTVGKAAVVRHTRRVCVRP